MVHLYAKRMGGVDSKMAGARSTQTVTQKRSLACLVATNGLC